MTSTETALRERLREKEAHHEHETAFDCALIGDCGPCNCTPVVRYTEAEHAEVLAALTPSAPTPTCGTETAKELRAIARWIRTPDNINRQDAIDDCARVLENRARQLDPTGTPGETP